MFNSQLSTNHLLGIKYITQEDIEKIFATAEEFKDVINRPIKKFHPYVMLPLQMFLKILQEHASHLNWLKGDSQLMVNFASSSSSVTRVKPYSTP